MPSGWNAEENAASEDRFCVDRYILYFQHFFTLQKLIMAAVVGIITITGEAEVVEGDEAATVAAEEATVASFPTGFRDIIQ